LTYPTHDPIFGNVIYGNGEIAVLLVSYRRGSALVDDIIRSGYASRHDHRPRWLARQLGLGRFRRR
jgi:hypothetical protein